MNAPQAKQFKGVPRFTAVDFYFGPLWVAGSPPGPVKVRGRAIQVITSIDANRRFNGAAAGTDAENCQCTWTNDASILVALLPNATLNGAGTLATFPASAGSLQMTTLVALPAANLTLPAFVLNGFSEASHTASTCSVAAGVVVTFPGGPAGVYTLNMPIFTGTVAPGHAGDATFNPSVGANVPISVTGVGIMSTNCTSTWTQTIGTPLANHIMGYVHLSKLNPHVPMNAANQVINITEQTIPILCSPGFIRVEQSFDQIIIEPVFGLAWPCAGVLIVEHDQEQVEEWTR
jgi:hypothetical protein